MIQRAVAALRHALKQSAYAILPETWQEAVDRRYYHFLLRHGLSDLSGEAEFELLPDLVVDGDTAFDIGANFGVYTLRLSALVGPSGQVHCFEPVPRTFRLLSHNVRRLAPYPNVRLHQAAISDVRGRTVLHVPLERGIASYYYASLAKDPSAPTRAIWVETMPLDEWVGQDVGRVTFLKIDTEGAELHVLHGAARLLQEFRPIIQCEVAEWIRRFDQRPGDVFEYLRPLGYQAFLYRGGRLQRVAGSDGEGRRNYLFLPPAVPERLRASVAFA